MTIYDRPFGRYFEDFEPGDVYRHWPGKTITEADDHLFCMITMNHHPLHTNRWFAEHETVQGKNVVVGNLVYSLALGMSVPDVSGSRHRQPRGRVAPPPRTDLPRRHHLRRDEGDRQGRVHLAGRPRRGHRRDQGLQPARRGGLLLPAQGDGLEAATPPRRGGGPTATTSGSETRRRAAGSDRIRRPSELRDLGRAIATWGSADGSSSRRPDLPWRATRDPWAVLVSEVMTQQTQVGAGRPGLRAVPRRVPDPGRLRRGAARRVLRSLAGARLQPPRPEPAPGRRRSSSTEHGGRVPDDVGDPRALPGVGPYTARAVLAFAFGHDVGVVDTNAGRVLARAVRRTAAPARRGPAAGRRDGPAGRAGSSARRSSTSGPRCARPAPGLQRLPGAPAVPVVGDGAGPRRTRARGSPGVSRPQSPLRGLGPAGARPAGRRAAGRPARRGRAGLGHRLARRADAGPSGWSSPTSVAEGARGPRRAARFAVPAG